MNTIKVKTVHVDAARINWVTSQASQSLQDICAHLAYLLCLFLEQQLILSDVLSLSPRRLSAV